MSDRLTELQEACGYSDGSDGEESDIDSLIAYKDALEDAYGDALDKLNLLLSAAARPGVSGMEDVCVIVRKTGRIEVPNAPTWERH
jgi:hypothetical protein